MTRKYRRTGPHPSNAPGAVIVVETPGGSGTRYAQLRLTSPLPPKALELAFRALERELHPEEETDPVKITLALNTTDPADDDPEHPMGITADAYDRLTDALQQAGFEIASGPDRAEAS